MRLPAMSRRRRRRRLPLGFWVFAAALVLAFAQRARSGAAIRISAPAARNGHVRHDDDAERLAGLVIDRGVADAVTDDELRAAWKALRKRARAGRPGAVEALFAVAEHQRDGRSTNGAT